LLGYQGQHLSDGLAGGKDIIYYEDPLAGADAKIPVKGSPVAPVFFSKYAPHSQLPGNLVGQNNTTDGRSGYHINPLPGKVVAQHAAQFLGIFRELQDAEFFPVDR
jgi:hypothetical protein